MADSGKNGLDPYLVASLIRQESEFNAGAVSRKSAYGLMQLLPSVGKSLAKKEGIKRFDTQQLLDPSVNLQLGTRNLKGVIDRYGGQVEYALAAYNAGDTPVRQWLSTATTRMFPSSSSPSRTRKPATMCRPSCAIARCTASFIQRAEVCDQRAGWRGLLRYD